MKCKNKYNKLSHCILTPIPSIPKEILKDIKDRYSPAEVDEVIQNVRKNLTTKLIKYYAKIGFNEDVPNLPGYLLGSIYNIVNKIDSIRGGLKKTRVKKNVQKRTKKKRSNKDIKKNQHKIDFMNLSRNPAIFEIKLD